MYNFQKNKYTRRLLSRDAVYGGITQAFRSITEATDDVKLDYYDFVSMYPYLNSGGTAYSRGYKVLRYHEIWYWPGSAWEKGGFFIDYIKPLLVLKHQSSRWPKENMSDEDERVCGLDFGKGWCSI
ncbi:unnamed protein product [Caenorhabditis nigoni]